MKATLLRNVIVIVLLVMTGSVNAQIKYRSDGKLTIGNTEPYEFYHQTIYGNGMFFKAKTNNFFQIDCTPAATRLASHYDQVVFYNTKTSTFNSIQVKNVYNYSDARAKTDIKPLNSIIPKLMQLKTYSYHFADDKANSAASPFIKGGNANEYGLLAQEVELVFPELVITDPDGNKLINYTELIPMLLKAVQEMNMKLAELNSK